MFVIEAAIAKAAEGLGVEAALIQKRNLAPDGGGIPLWSAGESEAHACWQKAEDLYDLWLSDGK